LRNTVEELLLVADGKVTEFDGDLQDYSNWLLKEARAQKQAANAAAKETALKEKEAAKNEKKAERQQSAENRKQLAPLKQQLQKIEREMESTQKKLATLNEQLADTALYEAANSARLQTLLKEQGVLQQQVSAFEEQWLALQEEIERAST
jgi:ATP-binding cassette subfamily F protein 3